MAAATLTPRLPFGELGTARMQSLVSAKNCQNATTDILATSDYNKGYKIGNPMTTTTLLAAMKPSAKRAYEPAIPEDDESDPDTENVDPTLLSSQKRTKCNDGKVGSSTPQLVLSTETSPYPTASKPYLSLKSSGATVVTRKVTPPPHTLPSGALTAPAGRSPKHKRINLLSAKRPSLYKSISPPSFSSRSNSVLPFSLDAAIRGTVSSSSKSTVASANASNSIDKSKPKSWFFTIYEDTPDDEAAILMEHSTLCLDLSSEDDENGGNARLRRDDRGKENIPPPDHVASNGIAGEGQIRGEMSLSGATTLSAGRRSKPVDDMADVGEERAPLGEMAAEDFYPAGLDACSVEIVAAEPEAAQAIAKDEKAQHVVSTPVLTVEDFAMGLMPHASLYAPSFVIAEDPLDV